MWAVGFALNMIKTSQRQQGGILDEHQMEREEGRLWNQCDTEAMLSGTAAWSENPCVLV